MKMRWFRHQHGIFPYGNRHIYVKTEIQKFIIENDIHEVEFWNRLLWCSRRSEIR